MTGSRKLTLSVEEFSHLVSESLDIGSPTSTPQSFVHQRPVVSENFEKPKPSTFQRIFSRHSPTPVPQEDLLTEQLPDTPRKMGFGWPFSRSSPQKRRSGPSEVNIVGSGHLRLSKSTDVLKGYRSAASAAGSTSSLGSLVPVHERKFGDVGRESLFSIAAPPATSSAQSQRSTVSVLGSGVKSAAEGDVIDVSRKDSLVERAARERTDTSSTLATTETDFSDDDPTPRATTFGARAMISQMANCATPGQRRRPLNLSLVMPTQNCESLSLRPAVGATPHPPSDTDGSVSASSIPSPTSPLAHQQSLASMSIRSRTSATSRQRVRSSSPSKSPTSATPSDVTRSPNSASASSVNGFPWGRARAGSRSMKSPPLPRPPPSGPLPAVPISSSSPVPPVPPVPPLPSLLKKKSMMLPSKSPTSSPSRLAFSSSTISVATPPSPPGNLRLPSRLSWIGTGRAVVAPSSTLPSPPASPIKTSKSRLTPPNTPSRAHKSSGNLKRPTSIGVLEAADNAVVRRTKSILLLGSRSKSNGCLGVSSNSPPKRVQIQADATADSDSPTRKARRKSCAVPVSLSGPVGAGVEPIGPQILVLRERRHSAPLLRGTTFDGGADWTLSLPFSIDIPGGKMLPPVSPSDQIPGSIVEPAEDWTLCMPLKVRVEAASVTTAETEESVSESTQAQGSETCVKQTQLPTPSPSPTPSTPSLGTRALDPSKRLSDETLSPHAGGLDMDGGCGKRGSGWDVSGWFGSDDIVQEAHHASTTSANNDFIVPRTVRGRSDDMKVPVRSYEGSVRNPSQDSTNTTSTLETVFYSARSSMLST